jgi:sugar lactone lactonase YvrE
MGNFYIADQDFGVVQKVAATTGIITAVAGNGTWGCGGDGGPATSAQLEMAMGVAVDGAGNIYIADFYCHRVREVVASTGNIITAAGTGTYGYSGDNGPATSAEVSPNGVAVDGAGNLYIADSYHNVVREVSAATGIITTVAGNGTDGWTGDGGPATSAELQGPGAVALDGNANLYITSGGTIRKVTAATGIISTVAGNGTWGYSGDGGPATSAEINEAQGLAVDPVGDIYIADTMNNRIRLVTASTGIITTFAGDGAQGFSGDGGLATSAELYWPDEVALDLSGNAYIADMSNDRIRCVGASPVTGYVDPKYQILTLAYPPPGSKSYVIYSANTTVGTSVSLSNALSNGVSVATTVGSKTSIVGNSVSGTGSASQQWTQEADTSSSVAITFAQTMNLEVYGPASDTVGVDHALDQIFVWMNPKMSLTTTASPNLLLWNGFAYDTRDPVGEIDYFYLTPSQISTSQIPYQISLLLQRSWDSTLGAVTSADLQTIEAADPFATNSSYNPSSDPSGRYDSTSNLPLLYEPPQQGGQPDTEQESVVYGATSQTGQGAQYSYQTGYAIDASTSTGFNIAIFSETITTDMKSSQTATWTSKWNVLNTTTENQTATASITGPQYSAGYNGDIEMQVWKDNIYGTFMFYPVQ